MKTGTIKTLVEAKGLAAEAQDQRRDTDRRIKASLRELSIEELQGVIDASVARLEAFCSEYADTEDKEGPLTNFSHARGQIDC